ncbi:MAG: hypothetical protein O7H41_15810, partial [Planctomycetota bacterium]|nr:hypothetical protein [Planctomycetota bacterium]
LGQIDLGFTQLPDNLLRGMSLLGHLRLLPGSRILTSLLDRFQGAGSPEPEVSAMIGGGG